MCASPGCNSPSVGRSKYCAEHRAEARKRFKVMMAEQSVERAERYAVFADILANASLAGFDAGQQATPETMIVTQHTNQLDDTSPVAQQWIVPEGPCGFAWVNVSPGNSSFARWLVKNGHAHKAHRGGVDIWIGAHGQSYERKRAHAGAMADEITRAEIKGVTVYASGRLD